MTVRPLPARLLAVVGVLLGLTLVCWRVWAQQPKLPVQLKPPPAYRNVHYGPHERNVVDIWRPIPASGRAKPTSKTRPEDRGAPLVVFFHGGAFRQGSKADIPARLLVECLSAGIAVASASYRLSQDAPYPAPMRDGARAVQYLRLHAKEFDIDPDRIGASGSSAGAGIALWVGFHDDLADPQSVDPVLRQSSRVRCLGVDGAQTSYDPRFIKRVIGGRAHEHSALRPFFGLADADLGTPKAHKLFEDASPIQHATADDPPVILFYTEPDKPLPANARPGLGIHHPRFGAALKAKLDPMGVECVVRHARELPARDDLDDAMFREMTTFFVRHLRIALSPTGVASGRPKGKTTPK